MSSSNLTFFLQCLYSVVHDVSIEEAAYDLSREGHVVPIKVKRFMSKFSWFVLMFNRLKAQIKNKKNHPAYEVDDLIPVFNPHGDEEDEDNDPHWFSLRKLQYALKIAVSMPFPLSDCRMNLLQWVHHMTQNAVEDPFNYYVNVQRPGYILELDNHDISCFMMIVDLCRNKREEDRVKRIKVVQEAGGELVI